MAAFGYRPASSRSRLSARFGGYRQPVLLGLARSLLGRLRRRIGYTLYTSFLDLDIRRRPTTQSLFEGHAQARSQSNDLPRLVPNLVEAMFTGFPGNNGETVQITVMPDRRRARR